MAKLICVLQLREGVQRQGYGGQDDEQDGHDCQDLEDTKENSSHERENKSIQSHKTTATVASMIICLSMSSYVVFGKMSSEVTTFCFCNNSKTAVILTSIGNVFYCMLARWMCKISLFTYLQYKLCV